jgi:DNA-binding transcriptional LysR family regulator
MIYILAMHDCGLDLGTLRALARLLDERSVTRAARALGLSQPAVSHALARARAALGDPLLVRAGARLVPTPRAEALREPLARALADLGEALSPPAPFDPAASARSFALASADLAALALLPPLAARLGREAPGVSLRVVPAAEVFGALAGGGLDLSLGRHADAPAGYRRQRLFAERFVCVARADHPAFRGRPSVETWAALRHVAVAPGGRPGTLVDGALARVGLERRIALAVPHFLVVPHVVAESDLVATLPRRVAMRVARPLGLALHPPPVELERFEIFQLWHERSDGDAGHRWLRGLVKACVRAEA